MTDQRTTEALAAWEHARGRLGACMETLEDDAGRRRALDALTACTEAFAAWERARIAAGIPEAMLRPLHVSFWRWAPVCLDAITAGASMPPGWDR